MVLTAARRFNFATDTFAYANELVWEYRLDEKTGTQTAIKRIPPPTYAQHCFVLVRSARQFLLHAIFDPAQPVADDVTCQKLIKAVVRRSTREESIAADKIIVPGFGNLREFSTSKRELLQSACGGSWQSYAQHGNWRMIFPFSRAHQEGEMRRMQTDIGKNLTPIVHIATFPSLTINHALLLHGVEENEEQFQFQVYDPNIPEKSVALYFNKQTKRFSFPSNHYFIGGEVKIYEIYRNFLF